MKNSEQTIPPAPTCPKCSSPLITPCGEREAQCLGCGHKWKDDPIEQFIRETEVLSFHIEQYTKRWKAMQDKIATADGELNLTLEQTARITSAMARIDAAGGES